MSHVVESALAVSHLPIGSVLRGTEAVAVREGNGWIVSGYIEPRTHDDVEEFLGGYPLQVIYDADKTWTAPTWGDVVDAVSSNWQSEVDDVAEAVMRLIYPDGGWARDLPGGATPAEVVADEGVRKMFDLLVYPNVLGTLQGHLDAALAADTRIERLFLRVPRNTIALAIGALTTLRYQRDEARAALAAVATWRRDWLAPPKSDTYPHQPSVHVRRLDDILNG